MNECNKNCQWHLKKVTVNKSVQKGFNKNSMNFRIFT